MELISKRGKLVAIKSMKLQEENTVQIWEKLLRLMAEKALIEASNEVVEVTIEDVEAEVEEDFQEDSKCVLIIIFFYVLQE